MKVSIVMPIRYRADLTRVAIDSIKLYTTDYELILVQEGEDKEIQDLLLDYVGKNDNFSYLQNVEPKGYSGALNTGIREALGKYICIINNDIVATPNWMDEMVKVAEEDKEVGLVSPTFWGSGGRQSVDWNYRGDIDNVLEPLHLIGVCYLIPKKVYDDVGEWDESFGHGGEDFDMVIRIQNKGYKTVIARKSFIYHYGGASTRIVLDDSYEKIRENQRQKLIQLSEKHGVNYLEKINE